jgi:hypothetical protein
MATKPVKNISGTIWLAVSLALLTAVAYIFIALGLLPVGIQGSSSEESVIIFVAAGCYVLGGLLILTQRRWLWIIGILINALVVFFFLNMYHARPEVMFSVGGLVTKIPQILLEILLVYLLIKSWIKKG